MKSLYENESLAKAYLKYRPVFPKEVAEVIINYMKYQLKDGNLSSTFDLSVDVGCGNGQGSSMFAPYFKNVVGVDASECQIKLAKEQNQFENVEYLVGRAEELPFQKMSVDLVTAAMSAHWFDLPSFFEEVSRVLKPGGCMAIFGYWIQSIARVGDVETKQMSTAFEQSVRLLRDLGSVSDLDEKFYKKMDLELVNGYRDLFKEIPFSLKERVDHITIANTTTLSGICGFISSIMGLGDLKTKQQKLNEIFGDVIQIDVEKFDVVQAVTKNMMKIWNSNDANEKFEIVFNVYILLASPAND
ncbi:putative methyltransferase DDB_G0268948 [Clavelina lepadiformis]|uniref:Methyltransferase type 11 domain-containing protein n=1 Tax=Clavelina lepadiformis TaxID=159417 RepID=A0ABP0FQ62_CLALP